MPRYYEKCCFEADVIGKRVECDRLSCVGKHTEFTKNLLYFFIKLIIQVSIRKFLVLKNVISAMSVNFLHMHMKN